MTTLNERRRSGVSMKVSGNDLFVTAMKKEGVDTIFAYPGGMVVNLLDALHDCHGIDLVLPRHEQRFNCFLICSKVASSEERPIVILDTVGSSVTPTVILEML